jgi:hypothetical protein
MHKNDNGKVFRRLLRMLLSRDPDEKRYRTILFDEDLFIGVSANNRYYSYSDSPILYKSKQHLLYLDNCRRIFEKQRGHIFFEEEWRAFCEINKYIELPNFNIKLAPVMFFDPDWHLEIGQHLYADELRERESLEKDRQC